MANGNDKKQQFVTLLHELFQLDQPELDFGFYRIMHAKSVQIKRFIDEELAEYIDQAFAGRANQSAEQQAEQARQTIVDSLGDNAFDDEGELKVDFREMPVGKQYLDALQALREGGALSDDAEIYDHLYRFFSRYYDNGDFLSTRYRQAPSDTRDAPYSVPYDGREVYLHWANKDQYYIKSSETLRHYGFDLNAAVGQARKADAGAMPGWTDSEDDTPRRVLFRIVDAAEGAHGNVKEDEQRFFLIHAAEPVRLQEDELTVQFEYRPDSHKTGQNKTWQEKRLAEAEAAAVEGVDDLGEAAAPFKQALATPAPTDNNPHRSLLAKHLAKYTARHNMDYFIHKNLGGFLRRELAFYIKNEVMRLDHIEAADAPAVEDYLGKVKVIRQIARRIIAFLAQLEDFQKKLWLKKKFVTETNYCITLDRIPEDFYPEIAANQPQLEEWERLYSISTLSGYKNPLTPDFIASHASLMLDTRFFDQPTKDRLLARIERLDEQCSGILVNSDNNHALQLINSKVNKRIASIFIDPPYNTGDDGFLYKDHYAHSSWLSAINAGVSLGFDNLRGDGCMFITTGDEEYEYLASLVRQCYGKERFFSTLVWEKKKKGAFLSGHIARMKDYVICLARDVKEFGGLIGEIASDTETYPV